MSFGFSVGDFVALGKLAWGIYNACKSASKEFRDITEHVCLLHELLQSTYEQLERRRPQSRAATDRLEAIWTSCHGILARINHLLEKHRSLEKPRPYWHAVRWALRDGKSIEGKLIPLATSLSALNTNLALISQARVEENLDMLIRSLRIDSGSPAGAAARSAPEHSQSPHNSGPPSFRSVPLFTPHNDNEVEGEYPLGSCPTTPTEQYSVDKPPAAAETGRRPRRREQMYQRVTSTDQSIQINGDIYGYKNPSEEQQDVIYMDVTSSGSSLQCNGNVTLAAFVEFIKVQ